MNPVFIAIDTGGTRTNVEVATEEGGFQTRRFEVPVALSGILPTAEYSNVLRRIFAPIEQYWHEHEVTDRPVYVFISAAGFAAPTRVPFIDAIDATMPELLNGNIKVTGAANDASTLLWGYDSQGAVIAGTGSTTFARTSTGEIFQAGGHDWVAADQGSGFWVGLTGIRQVAIDLEAGNSSVLLNRFCEVYGISNGNEQEIIARFRALAVSDASMKADIARFAAAVCVAAELGDIPSQDIVKKEAEQLADLLAQVVRRRFTTEELEQTLTVVQCGSLLSNDFFRTAMESHVNMRLSPISGGQSPINWIYTKNGIEAAMRMAVQMSGDVAELLKVSPQYRPAIVRAF